MSPIEKRIIEIFSEITETLGYDSVNGKIIAILLMEDKEISLDELEKKSGYSKSAVSIALDFLEIIGMIKKIKKPRDRKLYASLSGDILQGLKRAIVLKIQGGIDSAYMELEKEEVKIKEDKNMIKAVEKLKKELKRINKYVDNLSEVKLPEY